MKRIFLVMLSVVFFVSSTFAQLPPAQMRARLAGKVEKAAQEASVKNLQEARSTLAIAYLSGMFGVVDEVLTQYPKLVNETIKGEDGKPIPMVYHAFKNGRSDMLKLFYNHGAKCDLCFEESLKDGELTVSESMTLAHHLPLYGATDVQFLKLKTNAERWLKKTKEIRLTSDRTLPELITTCVRLTDTVFKLVTSDDSVIQQQIDKYQATYEKICSLKKIHKLQKVAQPIKITFMGQVFTVNDRYDLKDVERTIDNEVNKSVGYGETTPKTLRTSYDSAKAQLEKARAQLIQQEKIEQKNRDLQEKNKESLNYIRSAISKFKGRLDIVLAFMERFPNQNLKRVEFITYEGIPAIKINVYNEPFIGTVDEIYDARPFTFGKHIGTIRDVV